MNAYQSMNRPSDADMMSQLDLDHVVEMTEADVLVHTLISSARHIFIDEEHQNGTDWDPV